MLHDIIVCFLTNAHHPKTPRLPICDSDVENYVLDSIVKLVESAEGDIAVVVDACALRHHAREEVTEFLKGTGFPVFAAPMGKSAVSEGYERYGGVRSNSCLSLCDFLKMHSRYTLGQSVTQISRRLSSLPSWSFRSVHWRVISTLGTFRIPSPNCVLLRYVWPQISSGITQLKSRHSFIQLTLWSNMLTISTSVWNRYYQNSQLDFKTTVPARFRWRSPSTNPSFPMRRRLKLRTIGFGLDWQRSSSRKTSSWRRQVRSPAFPSTAHGS